MQVCTSAKAIKSCHKLHLPFIRDEAAHAPNLHYNSCATGSTFKISTQLRDGRGREPRGHGVNSVQNPEAKCPCGVDPGISLWSRSGRETGTVKTSCRLEPEFVSRQRTNPLPAVSLYLGSAGGFMASVQAALLRSGIGRSPGCQRFAKPWSETTSTSWRRWSYSPHPSQACSWTWAAKESPLQQLEIAEAWESENSTLPTRSLLCQPGTGPQGPGQPGLNGRRNGISDVLSKFAFATSPPGGQIRSSPNERNQS